MDPWHDAVIAFRDGNAAAALSASDRVLLSDPRHAGALRMRGRLRYEAGHHAEALDDLAALAAIAPSDPEAHEAHGVALLALGRAHEARAALERARTLAPGHVGVLSNLAIAVQQCGLLPEAIALLRAARAEGAGARAELALGGALLEAGELDEASSAYARAAADHPFDAAVGRAMVLERAGRADEARALLQPLCTAPPPSPLAAARLATVMAMLSRSAPLDALRAVDAALTLPQSIPARQRLYHARARLLEADGRHSASFVALTEAHRAAAVAFDVRAHQRMVMEVVATFSATALKAPPLRGEPLDTPVFIVGLPRSGTSIVEQILACHPNVFAAGERTAVPDLVDRLCVRAGAAWPRALGGLDVATMEEEARALARGMSALSGDALRVTDKMPSNALHLGLISWLLPDARVIVCDRDPMDTLLSCHQQDFPRTYAWTRSLGGLGAFALLHHRLMAHWRSVLPLPILEVRYEELVTAPERVIPELVAFCGLPWDPACLHPERSTRYVSTASYDQVRRPISAASVGRWRRYAAELEPLRQMLVRGGLLTD